VRALGILVVLAVTGGVAHAYPQFQLSRDQTCSGCHVSPAGGGLLNENGMNTAEAIAMLGGNPEFMYGAIDTPDWLMLGGDIRAMGGWLHAPQDYLVSFPMQGELYAAARRGKLTAYINAGMRPAQDGNESATYVQSREHYVMWQSEEGATEGLFVRAGHFMPVFGLRWVEHPLYVRRYGGTKLFSETYGVSASYVKQRYEAHVTGFVENPLIDPVRQSKGGAAYGELRLDDKTAVGAGGMYEHFYEGRYTVRGQLTAKRLVTEDLLLQAEVQLANPHVSGYGYRELASYVMASYFAPRGVMVDVGWGHYDKNLRIGELDRDSIDVNVHWFATSHIELLLVNRAELIGLGKGGPTGALSMFQVHYRL
jgi:hypothetical protein